MSKSSMNTLKANKELTKWKENLDLDPELKAELSNSSMAELTDAFSTNLTFGTGGLRGIIGAGINRINIYVIRKTTYGLIKYLSHFVPLYKTKGVAIGYDSRHHSARFAEEAAMVLGAAGIKVYLAKQITPTPQMSFTVRHFQCAAGIMITASHNPPNYNGFKVFDDTGCQLLPLASDFISEAVDALDIFSIPTSPLPVLLQTGIVEYFDTDDAYLKMVSTASVNIVKANNLTIVFTPMHGTALVNLPTFLRLKGYNVITVAEQMIPDPNFSTILSPNPEDKASFKMAEDLGFIHQADILIATDPDADRMAVAVRIKEDEYYYLNGNETGALMLYYLAKYRKLNNKGVVINTIVTSNLAKAICDKYNVELIQTLTGFKYIGSIMNDLSLTKKEFLFGYEESIGYAIKDFVRDKDAFQASLLISEMASFYKERGQTLVDVMHSIDEEFGYYRNRLLSITLTGPEGSRKIKACMDYFRSNPLVELAGNSVIWSIDYLTQEATSNKEITKILLPKSNVLKFSFSDDAWVALRPSGTEPKLKIYAEATGRNENDALSAARKLETALKELIDNLLKS